MFNFSDDSNGSVKLEGKKLVEKGVHEEGKKPNTQPKDSVIEDPELNIGEETPALLDQELEVEQEYFTEQEYGKESAEERAERLRKEMQAFRQQRQIDVQQQRMRGPELDEQMKDPVKKVNAIEHSVMLSQNEGEPVKEVEFKQKDGAPTDKEAREEAASLRKTDAAGASFALGDNAKNLDFKDDQRLEKLDKQSPGSVSPTQLPDVRGKSQGMEI